LNNSVFFKSFKFYYLVLFIFFVAQLASGQERPNIIFIMADDLGYAELGSYGQKQIKTPHLDQLASEGMKFSQFYSGSSVCAPARSVLMTGMHTGHTRVRGNFEPFKAIRCLFW
jgi:arylsulfatase A-like enzyme